MPFVSIIMPVYNAEKYLDAAVNSVIAQTFPNWELLLIDDGSQDNCGALCDAWAQKDARVQATHKINAGQGAARNDGLQLAKGTYIAFMDSDDLLEPPFLETLVRWVRKDNLDFVRCGFARFFNNDTKTAQQNINPQEALPTPQTIWQTLMLPMVGTDGDAPLVPTACTTLYRTSVVRENEITFLSEREYQSEDLLFNLHFMAVAQTGESINTPLYLYRDNGASFTTSYNPLQFIAVKKLNAYLLAWGEQHGKVYESFTRRVQARLLDQTSVCIKKAVQFLPKAAAKEEIDHITKDTSVQSALCECDYMHLAFPLSLFCSLLHKQRTGTLYALIKAYLKMAPSK